MKYILDTHLLIWAHLEDAKLPEAVFEVINDAENEIFYSVASIWELDIKHSKSPAKMPISGELMYSWCERAEMFPLPILNNHVFQLKSLKRKDNSPPHNDPFDRILISQAKAENMILLTRDSLLQDYEESCVQLV